MSLSRGHPVPAAFSETCTRPEQSIPRLALAAPQVGRADKTFGNRDEIAGVRIEGLEMLARQVVAIPGDGEAAVLARHRDSCAHRKRIRWRQLDRRAGKGKGSKRRDLVRRHGGRPCQPVFWKPADIAIDVELAPGPAFAVMIVNRDLLAFQRLRQQHGIRGRRFA